MLYVPPKMTKTEVKEYLTKIYNVSVLQVMTSNFLGKKTQHIAFFFAVACDVLSSINYFDIVEHWLQENGNDSMEKEKSLHTSEETLKKP